MDATADNRYAGSELTPAEKARKTFQVREPDPASMGPDGPTATRTVGGCGLMDWYGARGYAEAWRMRGIPDADVYVVPSEALRAIFLGG
jgi:hypothetical protein